MSVDIPTVAHITSHIKIDVACHDIGLFLGGIQALVVQAAGSQTQVGFGTNIAIVVVNRTLAV